MSRIIRREAARTDLANIVYYYLQQGSSDAGHRFRVHAEATFERLANLPDMGTVYPHEHAALAGLRYFPLSAPFGKYVVFYRRAVDGIEVLRVLHGARDLDAILTEEFAPADDEQDDAD